MDKTPRLCMFCGKSDYYGKMSMEHFVPKCLWDSQRPEFTRTVPAHEKCNRRYSDDNEYFRDVMVADEASGNHSEVVKINRGSFRRKLIRRRGAVLKNLKGLGLRPRFSPTGLYVGHAPMFDCNWDRMAIVLKNVMKGVFYTVKTYPMPQDMEMTVTCVEDFDLLPVRDVIRSMGEWNGFGDDVFACRYVFHTEDSYMFCLMRFYGSRMFFGKGRRSSVGSDQRI